MNFNRKKFLSGEYDYESPRERKIYWDVCNRPDLSGLEWNMYIKDYVLFCIRSDLLKVDVSLMQPIIQFIPLIELGMFNTVADTILQMKFTEPVLLIFVKKWEPLLREANDIILEEE